MFQRQPWCSRCRCSRGSHGCSSGSHGVLEVVMGVPEAAMGVPEAAMGVPDCSGKEMERKEKPKN